MARDDWHLKYRPFQLDDLVGQQNVVSTLKQASKMDRFANSYFFVGTKGCGKTSSARILANLLTCDNPKDGQFYIATKGYSALFKLAAPLNDGMKAVWLCDLDISKSKRKLITALDFNDSGKLLVRTYSDVYEYDKPCGSELSFSDYGYKEKQGESIAYFRDGFMTISEGKKPSINIVKFKECKKCNSK